MEWQEVIGYEGRYKISDKSETLSISQRQILKQKKNKQGYLCARLYKDGIYKKIKVHKLVLEAFVGPCPEGMECRHLDGNKLNNKLENLCWGTHSENMQDKMEHGNHYQPDNKGSKHPLSKLNEKQIRIIKYLLKTNYLTQIEISKIFEVNKSTINDIKMHKTWTHVL